MWGEETLEYGKEHMIVMKKTMKDHKGMLISWMMQLGKYESNCKVNIAIFFLILISTSLYVMLRKVDMTIGDAEWYLSVGDSCFTENSFSLLNFPQTFRGCLFPLYLQFIKHSFLGVRMGWAITSGVMIGTLFAFIFPSFFGNVCAKYRLGIGMLMAFIYIGVFGDTIAYTLSDVFAAFFLITGVYAVMKLKSEVSKIKISVTASLSGICIYIAYNTRVVFLYGALIAVVVVLIFSDMERAKRGLLILSMFVGAFLISLPQCIVNLNREDLFSARVYTENYSKIYGEADNLQMQQMEWGLSYNRYETYLGGEYPSASVYFIDSSGTEILRREKLTDGLTVSKWFGLLGKYPLDMIGIYVRHVVSAMTPVFNRIYIYNLSINTGLSILVSLFIWILFFSALLTLNRKEVVDNKVILGVMTAFFVPALMQALGAVEVRFFLPGYFMAYGYVAYGIRYRELIKRIRPIAIQTIIVIAMLSVLWIGLICNVLSDNAETVILVNNELMTVSGQTE